MAAESLLMVSDADLLRDPTACRHRITLGAGIIACELVQRLANAPSPDSCHSELSVCNACCRSETPTVQRPNSVVASLACRILGVQLATDPDAHRAVDAGERLVWIEQFLDVCEPADHRTSRDHGRLASSVLSSSRSRRNQATSRGEWWRLWSRLTTGRAPQPRIGLAGFNNLKGLGHLNRDLIRHLGIQDWLLTGATSEIAACARQMAERVEWLESGEDPLKIVERFLSRIDILLFTETPWLTSLPRLANQHGVRVVCIPMWERLHPGLDWLPFVDFMLCPTKFTQKLLRGWNERFGFQWRVKQHPWPIDAESFSTAARSVCRRFVFINGTDMEHPRDRSGIATQVRRKGLETFIAAASRLRHVSFLIWSQVHDIPPLPDNVELRFSAEDNSELYRDGDVCVQLSRWEGLGLPLLECRAAGLPLITIDAPPMNEHHPLAVVPVSSTEVLELWPRRWITAPLVSTEDVVSVLQKWFGQDISSQSRAAQESVRQHHAWETFLESFRKWMSELAESRGGDA